MNMRMSQKLWNKEKRFRFRKMRTETHYLNFLHHKRHASNFIFHTKIIFFLCTKKIETALIELLRQIKEFHFLGKSYIIRLIEKSEYRMISAKIIILFI